MDAQVHTNPQLFWKLAGPHFLADPVRNTIAITVMERCLAGTEPGYTAPLMLTVHDNSGALVGAGLRTAPWPLLIGGLPLETVPAAVDAVLLHAPDLTAVNGPREAAAAFARAWTDRTGQLTQEKMASRLFRLGELTPPTVAGAARIGGAADLELLVKWREAFGLELDGVRHSLDERAGVLAAFEAGDPHFVWEVDGTPVSLAFTNAPSGGMARVRYVYTPVRHRGHGYASAATAAASRWALDQGATDVLLFTDLRDPVTNRIYPRLGYRPVFDAVEIAFSAGTADGAVPHMRGEHE
ncbi:GNAT family N-acetyltransferase [Crossiella sp. CA198]|uniref:GNAT family N-acetyltransferase n=1 Tax=Crossiella sp. CA198 TaxID=3455607 RepID=UPI003F8D04E3